MKIISNKTQKPIKIPLPGGRFLHLGPLKKGQIADQAAERPAIQKLVKAGEIVIYDENEPPEGTSESGVSPHESTHGHPQNKMVRPKGNR